MKIALLSVIALFLFAISASSPTGKVIELTDLTFDEQIEKNSIILILFYAPWCRKSKGFLSELEKAAKLIQQIGKNFIIAKVDATSQTEVADKVGIVSFPQLTLYLNKKEIQYDKKELTADLAIRFIEKQVRPPSVELITKEEIEGLKTSKGNKCLLISDDKKILEEFIEAAKLVKDIPFYHMTEKTGKLHFENIETFPVVLLIKNKGEEVLTLTETINSESIDEFVKFNMFPLVNTFSQDVLGQILKPYGRIGVALFRSASDPKAKKYDEEFHKLASTHRSLKLLFVISDPEGGMDEKVAKYINLEPSKVPLIVILEKKEDLSRYEYTGELTTEAMGAYLEDFKSGKITRTFKSEDEPAENKGPVYTVIGKTFKNAVLDNDMDVFVKFYAPWCGHCKTLTPIFEKLAERVKANKKIKLVEIDSTKNEIPGHNVQSFPTLKLFINGKKPEAIIYEGARTEEAMLKFLKENLGYEIVIGDQIKNEGIVEPEHDDGGMCDSSCKDGEHKEE